MTSAVLATSTSCAWVMGVSSALRRASNNSRMRISTLSGSRRVTTTSGFLPCAICLPLTLDPGLERATTSATGRPSTTVCRNGYSGLFNSAHGHLSREGVRWFLYQMDRTLIKCAGALSTPSGYATRVWACRSVSATWEADDRMAPGRDCGSADIFDCGGTDARGERSRDERPAGSALRQPQSRSRQCTGRARQGPRRNVHLHARRLAGGDYRRVRKLAAHPRLGWLRRLGLSLASFGQAHRLRAAEV